jgi:IS6 family transposase
MILNALVEKLKRRSRDDFKGRHFEAALILQAVSWYLRYPLSYRDIEELPLERGLEVDHSTLNRWVLAYAPLIERRLSYRRMLVTGGVRRQRLWASVLASSMDLSQPRLSYGVVHQPRWCRSCPRACAIGLSVLQ